jgi:KEOPS complex subunit Cgi121
MPRKANEKGSEGSPVNHPGKKACPGVPGTGNACGIRQVAFTIYDISDFLGHLRTLSMDYGSHIILFDKEMMAGRGHVDTALSHAFRAMGSDTCISSSVEIEALLYAAGSRQVIEGARFGVHEGVNLAYLCLCPDNREVWNILSHDMKETSDDWEEIDRSKKFRLMSIFNVTMEELAVAGEDRLKDLVVERVALLDAYK